MGTVPGPDVAALAVGVGAGGFCSSCVDVLASPVVSWLCGGSAEAAGLQEGPGDRRMHLWQDTRKRKQKITLEYLEHQTPGSPRQRGRRGKTVWDYKSGGERRNRLNL